MLKPQDEEETQCQCVNIECEEQHFQCEESGEPHPMLRPKGGGSSSGAALASLPCELNCFQESASYGIYSQSNEKFNCI